MKPLSPVPAGVRPPSEATLKNYGLTATEWLAMGRRQGWTCPVCLKPFGDRKLVVDHAHVRGWKARKSKKHKFDPAARVMTPLERKIHVRGVLHAWCNGLVRSWLTLDRARAIVAYLEAHENRKLGQIRG